MRKMIILRGLQGSGKSRWAHEFVSKDPLRWVRFCNDDIREMLGKYWVPEREDLVVALKMDFLKEASRKGYNIVMDNMNLNQKELDFLENWASRNGYKTEINDEFLKVPLEECIRRDKLRERPVGEEVIRKTWEKYLKPMIRFKQKEYGRWSDLFYKAASKALEGDLGEKKTLYEQVDTLYRENDGKKPSSKYEVSEFFDRLDIQPVGGFLSECVKIKDWRKKIGPEYRDLLEKVDETRGRTFKVSFNDKN